MADSSLEDTLIEEKKAQIICPSNGKPSCRTAYFLKPLSPPSQQPPNLQTLFNPKNPTNPNIKSLTSKLNFYGWRSPLNKWSSWVEKLRPSCESSWKKTSIYEPIMASTFEIPRCYDTLFAFGERWCPETDSFLLPWGEVTITLEDIMGLGGYSVLGDSVLVSRNNEELCEIENALSEGRREIMKTKAKKADQQQWMDIWMEKGVEFEHEAFLSLWLSRFVLPSDSVGTIHKSVFRIAILLARGTKFSLAPAVLARIYRDLRLLKEKIETFGVPGVGNLKKLNLWAPLQLFMMWVWERFPKLSPVPNVIFDGQPRSARWNKVKILRKNNVNLVIDNAKESFKWRPYCDSLNNCSFLAKLYPEEAKRVSVSSTSDIVLQSYARLIRASYLVGLDCIERYLPHRVSMQFGFDQDIPGEFPQLKSNNPAIAWNNYIRPVQDVELYMPSRVCEAGVTRPYFEWWKNSNCTEEDEKPSVANLSYECSPKRSKRMKIKLENNEADVPPGFEPKGKRIRLEEEDEGSNATQGCSKEVDAEDDSDNDNLTVSQFLVKYLNRANDEAASPSCSVTYLPSAGDDVGNQKEKNRAFRAEDGTENEDGSLIKNPTRIIEKEADLLSRIARLARIVSAIKMAQISQP